ncbi:MAG: retention module-containing protein, partial [Hylemonella sp.]
MAKIATITSITGKAFAISADGKIRELKLGDEIEKGEIIQTAAGGRVELQMVDGQAFAVAPEQLIKL